MQSSAASCNGASIGVDAPVVPDVAIGNRAVWCGHAEQGESYAVVRRLIEQWQR